MFFNMFTLSELKYPDRINYKGLLEIEVSESGEISGIKREKTAFSCFQNITTIFDNSLTLIPDPVYTVSNPLDKQFLAWHSQTGTDVAVLWNKYNVPQTENNYETVELRLCDMTINNPVLVDLLTGEIYEISQDMIESYPHHILIKNIPVYDSPIVICDKSICML